MTLTLVSPRRLFEDLDAFTTTERRERGAAHRVLIEPSLDDPCTALCIIDRAPKARAADPGSAEQATSDPAARNAASNTVRAPISERRGLGEAMPHEGTMTHLSVRACAAESRRYGSPKSVSGLPKLRSSRMIQYRDNPTCPSGVVCREQRSVHQYQPT